jgi:septum formation protein
MLLRLAQIPFQVIGQDADESACDWTLSLEDIVKNITLYKMQHAAMPAGHTEGQRAFVLTADTLTKDMQGNVHGKPTDREDAKRMLRITREGSVVATAFCIEKRLWSQNRWQVQERVLDCVTAFYRFNVPESLLDYYLDNSPSTTCANATAVEELGLQFLEYVEGSYTSIIGLPLFEVRQALTKLGFFESHKHTSSTLQL